MKALRPLWGVLTGIAVTVLMVAIGTHVMRKTAPPPAAASATEKLEPSLNCAFYDFMHAHIIVGFDFAVLLQNGAPPRFEERAEGTGEGAKMAFESDHRPIWTYGNDEDGTPMITSPDGATRIVLYGVKLDIGGVLFSEAGVRSNEYRNLGGECRQVNLATPADAHDADSRSEARAASDAMARANRPRLDRTEKDP